MVCVCCGWSGKREGGKRCLESDGKVFGAWISCWKRQVLATARLQRREGQLKEKFGLFVDFEFLTEMGSWGTD